MAIPSSTQKPKLNDFDAWARRLRRLIRKANGVTVTRRSLRPRQAPEGVIRFRCYSYYRRLKKQGLLSDLERFVRDRDRGRWRHPAEGAAWILRLIETRPRDLVTPATRARIITELNFADRCNVPASRLLGFLYEAGNDELLKRQAAAAPLRWVAAYSE